MQEIRLHIELHFLKQAGKGFIRNEFNGQANLHRVNCDNFDTISSKLAQMKFFETYPEATEWLNNQVSHWSSCRECRPVSVEDAQSSHHPSLPTESGLKPDSNDSVGFPQPLPENDAIPPVNLT